MLFESYNESGEELDTWTVYSIGGGTLANESFNELRTEQVYDMHTIKEIQAWCEKTGHSYWEYVEQHEGPSIWDYLAEVWEVMFVVAWKRKASCREVWAFVVRLPII